MAIIISFYSYKRTNIITYYEFLKCQEEHKKSTHTAVVLAMHDTKACTIEVTKVPTTSQQCY